MDDNHSPPSPSPSPPPPYCCSIQVWFYAVAIFFVISAAVVHFVLLILKTDRNADFTYSVVIIPAIIAYSVGIVVFSAWSLLWFLVSKFGRGFGFLAITVLLIGSLWSQIQLARKFDMSIHVTYLEALLPVTVALVVSGILFIVGLVVSSVFGETSSSSSSSSLGLTRKPKVKNRRS